MTITSSGPLCDVCDRHIFPWDTMTGFGVKGITTTLHCHDACREAIVAAGRDWTLLPDGPLRRAFAAALGAKPRDPHWQGRGPSGSGRGTAQRADEGDTPRG